MTGRLALSQQSSRFTLPIDMARLERESSTVYINDVFGNGNIGRGLT